MYGSGFVRELELLQEAGLNPHEVLRAATYNGAVAIDIDRDEDTIGTVETGKKADLVLVKENPLENLKLHNGTGAVQLDDTTGAIERTNGIRWTIKDGIVFDAQSLLDEVEVMVRDAKEELNLPTDCPMPLKTPAN